MVRKNDSMLAIASSFLQLESQQVQEVEHTAAIDQDMLSSKKILAVKPSTGKPLMPHGPEVLFRDTVNKIHNAFDHPLPQMDIRFSNLSIAVDIPVMNDTSLATASHEIPTLVNVAKQSLKGLCAKKKYEKHYILKDVSGVLRPGTTTLVLGRPGSGKSSLMKVLSGRFPVEGNGVSVEGEILYNGQRNHEIHKQLPQLVSYVTQRDVHLPSLTVQETLDFAHSCCSSGLMGHVASTFKKGTPEDNAAAQQAVSSLLEQLPEVVLELLGLQNCKDTVVGDVMTRGVSGGERRRVTTGEMLFGAKLALFMDDISTGLDSAATYDIVNSMRSAAKCFGTTIVISLLQPSPEVFALFDDVLILSEGEMVYHGPQAGVVNYFEELGFVCPLERDGADFLLDMGTDTQARYQVSLRPSSGSEIPQSAAEFSKIFKASNIFRDTMEAIETPHDPEYLEIAQDFVATVPEFRQDFWESTIHVLKRELFVLGRNSAFIKGRAVMIIIMGMLYASIFYQFDPTKVQVVMGITFSATLFISLGQASQIPVIMAARDVFYKQRRSNFFRTSSLVLSSAVSRIPVALIESGVFGSLLYWMCGFSSNAASFISFEILLFLMSFAMGTWFYFLSTVTPNTNVAIPVTLFSILLSVAFAGFMVPRQRIPDFLVWLYWITPMSWCIRGIMVNQYQSPEFATCVYGGIDYCKRSNVKTAGKYFLSLYDVPSGTGWIYGGMIYMLAFSGLLIAAATFTLEYRRYESPEAPAIVKKAEIARASDLNRASNSIEVFTHGSEVQVNVQRSHQRQFTPVTLAFQDLWYTVQLKAKTKDDPTSIDLLKGISGYAKPGTMTALMGASGAGKTTLMDVIAARKTGGKIQGTILLNGYKATDTVIRRCAGYCEQMDVHSEASTFREALTFSAFLRQSSDVSDELKLESVDECLELLDLYPIADKIIRGSSMEQMKRLTIGVELAAQPSVLFLDEPTSGLDAQAAKSIMEGVRKVANSGRTVMCTIHQPSAEVFEAFDNLLLLKKGGETVYFGEIGEESRTLVEYFESIPGVARLEKGYNPATWMLECVGAGVSNNSSDATDFGKIYNQSTRKQAADMFLNQEGVNRPSPKIPELKFSKKRASSGLMQAKFLVSRALTTYWRTASYNLTRFFISLALALVFGVVFAGAEYKTYQGVNAGVGMVFLSTVFCGLVSFFSVLPVAFAERAAFYRERAAQTYNVLWYFLGISIAEIPYVFFSAALYTAVFYPLVGFTGFQTAIAYWLNTALLILMQTYTGQLLAFALPSEELALLLSVLLNTIFFLFMGFNPPVSTIPKGFKWLYYVIPKRYSFSILAALVFANCPESEAGSNSDLIGCQPLLSAPPTTHYANVKEYVEDIFGAKQDEVSSNVAVVLLLTVVIRVLGLLALRFINHQKR